MLSRHPAVQRLPQSWENCSGWLHTAAASRSSDVAIVICPGVGRDSSTGYRPSRFLADHLALSGYPSLRFSYPGTGDSLDLDDEDYWLRWIGSVHSAIDRTLATTTARRVVLIGFRLGAALAAQVAADRQEIAGLVLVEPVVRGKSFVTQLQIEERVTTRGASTEQDTIRLHGLHLTRQALATIANVDLRSVVLAPGRRVLVVSDSRSPTLQGCEEAWRHQGVSVVRQEADAMAAFFRPTHLADEPYPDLRQLMLWLNAETPPGRSASSIAQPLGNEPLRAVGWIETPHLFGRDATLFGVLCEPDQPAPGEAVVIIGNGGGDPHDGFARFAVEFARDLAKLGIASFRIDFAGLGDSINAADDADGLTHPFTVDRRPDFAAAIDFVMARGFRSIALQGLCSGAYHALQAAVADPRVGFLLCVNLPWFSLRHEKAGPGSFASQATASLSARGARTLLLFADDEPGIKALEQHFGRVGHELAACSGFEIAMRSDLDHDLTRPEMRRAAVKQMIAFMRQEPLGNGRICKDVDSFSGDRADIPRRETAEPAFGAFER